MKVSSRLIASAFIASLLVSCDSEPKPSSTPEVSAPSKLEDRQIVDGSATGGGAAQFTTSEAERTKLLAFGEEVASALQTADRNFVLRTTNFNAFADRIFKPLKLSGRAVKPANQFRSGIIAKFKSQPAGILNELHGQPCELLRFREIDGEPRLLFRSLVNDAMVYWEIIPSQIANQTQIADIFLYSQASLLSATIRTVAAPIIAQESRTPVGKLFAEPDPLYENMEKFATIGMKFNSGDFEGAYNEVTSMPPAVRNHFLVLMQEMRAVQMLAMDELGEWVSPWDKRYEETLEKFQTHHSGHPSLPFLLLDYHILKKDTPAAMKSLDVIENWVGGDNYLDVARANIYLLEEDYENARKYAEIAMETRADFEDTYWTVTSIAIAEKDHALTAKTMSQLAEKFGYNHWELEGNEYYNDFVASEIGKAWIKENASMVAPIQPPAGQ